MADGLGLRVIWQRCVVLVTIVMSIAEGLLCDRGCDDNTFRLALTTHCMGCYCGKNF